MKTWFCFQNTTKMAHIFEVASSKTLLDHAHQANYNLQLSVLQTTTRDYAVLTRNKYGCWTKRKWKIQPFWCCSICVARAALLHFAYSKYYDLRRRRQILMWIFHNDRSFSCLLLWFLSIPTSNSLVNPILCRTVLACPTSNPHSRLHRKNDKLCFMKDLVL